MAKIQTALAALRDGVKFSADDIEVRFPPTGNLSVELLDASGTQPIASRALTVDIVGEGPVHLTTDENGRAFHPDVPFAEYELHLEGAAYARVFVPAVATDAGPHRRHVPDEKLVFVDLVLRDQAGAALARRQATLRGADGDVTLDTDANGNVGKRLVLAAGKYTLRVDDREVEIELPALPHRMIVAV